MTAHFSKAEHLAAAALDADHLDEAARMRYAAVAQVHASLALVDVGRGIEKQLDEIANSLEKLEMSVDAPFSDVASAIRQAGAR